MSSKILSAQGSKNRRSQRSGGNVTGMRPPNLPPASDSEFRGLPNRAIITIVLTLCCFGLMAVYSASAPEALQSYQDSTIFLRRQAVASLIGLFVMFTVSRYDYRRLKKWSWPFAFVSFGLLCLTLVPGLSKTTMGATRWLALGPVQFQPSEFCKIASIILMSAGLSKYFWWNRQILYRLIVSLLIGPHSDETARPRYGTDDSRRQSCPLVRKWYEPSAPFQLPGRRWCPRLAPYPEDPLSDGAY